MRALAALLVGLALGLAMGPFVAPGPAQAPPEASLWDACEGDGDRLAPPDDCQWVDDEGRQTWGDLDDALAPCGWEVGDD